MSVLLATAAFAASPEQDVLAALDQWKFGYLKKDRATLEKVFHKDVAYVHSSGLIETKTEAIDKTVGGTTQITAIDMSDTKVRIIGNTAIVTGIVDLKQKNAAGEVTANHLSMMTAWVKGSGGWQMVGRQATRPPAK